ncbi:MAG TPA: polyamine ABC transporter ATP-binding protein [Microthrixaceae bacterium]|nr:polyamine ABC transporter ATP-binding protein [Microthrixaceae bacterium]
MSVPTSEPTVVLQNVRKEFGSYVAVERADFAINAGEFFSLLGPSGCGKTTLLKMIAGFEQPTEGAVLLEGSDVSTVPPHKRNVNTVFQQYALFPHMSIVDNVAFGLRSKKVAANEARTRSMEMLDVVKLAEFANRRPNQLSGGQQQRVALARALVNLPAALLLDEPLAALDLKLREAMQIELKRIQREVGITFVFVTHDQGEALTMSDRIAVMSRGRVEQIGTPSQIYDRPESIFVAGFIGSANLLPGKVSGPLRVDLAAGTAIDVPGLPQVATGDDVTVMIRPERLTPHTGDPVAGRSVAGTIDEVIYQGSETMLIVHLADSTEILVSIDPDHATPDTAAGRPVTLTWVPEAPFVMPGRTAIVGATGTDFNEVEATMAGDLDADDDVEGGEGHPNPPAQPVKVKSESRRRLLLGGGALVAAGLGAVALSNVGSGDGGSSGTGGSASGGSAGGGLGQGDQNLRIINWTEYIDVTEDGEPGTIDLFNEETGIDVTYSETWNDNNEGYSKEFVAYLEAGNPTPWDIAMPTYWMAARIRSKDWIAPLPFNLIPNYVNLDPQYLAASWDPGAKFNLPWQAGVTGIAYNIAETGRELTGVADLFDPEFKGRVGFFTEMRDTLGLVMLEMGADPAKPTEDSINAALDRIEGAKNDGQIRRFTGNDYLQDIQNGNFAACIAWSGDIAQATNPDVRFVFPEEGAMSWYDTMVIPVGAPNGVAAAKFMNYVYDPVNAARIAQYVQFISPVLGVREELEKLGGDAAALAESPLLFPGDEEKTRMHIFGDMSEDLDEKVTDRFTTIIGG